ncbi:uncharacterized protein [Physcomitrium patens]|uniref:Uncharacterized protein n=1 Tax=Physcomitrium patens TaxID=3218 RepID=A0A2K1JZE3_PHYPA|nr:uncharacterized protein LOC112288049 isoform X1 [Physcomitrium patens]PNR46895.1 hypothetical protein PHYPA_014015 [Physcomitrium patens]|eukprot:XP_024387597.1 uncharacterized protein LOC112288049 isoform X1 [Physcomitrella patens]
MRRRGENSCRVPMCRDCKDAMRDASTHDASARQGETPLLTTPGGNSAAPGTAHWSPTHGRVQLPDVDAIRLWGARMLEPHVPNVRLLVLKISVSDCGLPVRLVVTVSNRTVAGTQELDDPAVQLANLTIDLDDNCVERIKVKDNESAEEVARKVCRSNNLPGQFVALLAEHIIDRYPRRPVDQKPEEAAAVAGGEETRDSKPGRSQNEGTTIRESPHKI